MSDCKPYSTPVDTQAKLSEDDGPPIADATSYWSLTGALQYLTFSRPDIPCSWVPTSSLGPPNGSLSSLAPALRPSIAPWPTAWQRPPGCDNSSTSSIVPFSAPPSSTATTSAVYLSTNPVQHQRTKHVEIDLHFVRERVAAGDVRVQSVPTTLQFADIFTKGLPSSVFLDFRSSLNICIG
jgi:hypothetical protein